MLDYKNKKWYKKLTKMVEKYYTTKKQLLNNYLS